MSAYIDPQPILDRIAGERGPLFTARVEAPVWPELRQFLRGGRWLAIRLELSPVRQWLVISDDVMYGWDGAERIDVAEALRLAQIFLRLRRSDEVQAGGPWARQLLPASPSQLTTSEVTYASAR